MSDTLSATPSTCINSLSKGHEGPYDCLATVRSHAGRVSSETYDKIQISMEFTGIWSYGGQPPGPGLDFFGFGTGLKKGGPFPSLSGRSGEINGFMILISKCHFFVVKTLKKGRFFDFDNRTCCQRGIVNSESEEFRIRRIQNQENSESGGVDNEPDDE